MGEGTTPGGAFGDTAEGAGQRVVGPGGIKAGVKAAAVDTVTDPSGSTR